MEAQGPDVDRMNTNRRLNELWNLELYKSMLNSSGGDHTYDENIKIFIKLCERRLTIPDPKYFRINDDLRESESKSEHESVNLACMKVIGMDLDLYIQEFASDDGFHIPVTTQGVVSYYMRMIAECQKHGFYEPLIPTVLTMIYFGKVYSTHPSARVFNTLPRVNSYDINSIHIYPEIITNISSKDFKAFKGMPSCSRKKLITMFDPRCIIMEAKFYIKTERTRDPATRYRSDEDIAEREDIMHAIIDAAKELIDYS